MSCECGMTKCNNDYGNPHLKVVGRLLFGGRRYDLPKCFCQVAAAFCQQLTDTVSMLFMISASPG